MSNALYPAARQQFLTAGISWTADTIKVMLVDSTYTYDSTDVFVSDLTGGAEVARSGALSTKTATDGIADADDVTFTAVTGDPVAALVIYKDTGSDATSRLIAFIDTKSNSSAVAITPVGDDITITWSNGANKIFKL